MSSRGNSGSLREILSDAEMVSALIDGDQRLFAELVDSWSPAMLRVAQIHVSNRQSAEDVVQEAWMAALRGLTGFEGRGRLRSWVIGIVFNLARKQGSREQRDRADISIGAAPTVDPERFQGPGERYPGGWRQFPTPWPGPEDSAVQMEFISQVSAAIMRLPDRQRAVIELRDLHGYNGEEVAQILDLTAGNQRILLHRARATVRRELESYFAKGIA